MMRLEHHDPELMRSDIGGRRHYEVSRGRLLPSVTTILDATSTLPESFGYRRWLTKMDALGPTMADDARDVAAARGDRMHRAIGHHLTTRTEVPRDIDDPWLRSVAKAVRQWNAVARLLLCEGAVWSTEIGAAGTLDLMLWIAGEVGVWDVKTSAKPWPPDRVLERSAQLGAYIELAEATYPGLLVSRAGFLIALPDGDAQMQPVDPSVAVSSWRERHAAYREMTQTRGRR